MNSVSFDPRSTAEMPEIREDLPKSDLPVTYPNNGFNGRPIGSLRFLLPSFLNLYGRSITTGSGSRSARTQFDVAGWLITIDRLADADKVYNVIRSAGEHEWTHQGHIQRTDGAEFTWAEAENLLDFLYHLFTFSCASPRAAQQIVALDRFGKYLFSKDESGCLLGSAQILSWFPEGFENPFSSLAPGLHHVWQDANLYEVAIFVIGVLYEANREELLTEFKFVLAQTALELLANTIFVEAWGQTAPDAAGKIRGLLQGLKIDIAIPLTLRDLAQEAVTRSSNYPGEANWMDGPQAVVQIRNMVTHADAKKRKKLFGLSDDAKAEASRLAIHYVELISLWLFGYDGPISTRIDLPQILGKHIQTPWPAGGTRPGSVAP